MMMDGHQGLWRIADALDDGVDMLTDTKKILRFDEYKQSSQHFNSRLLL